MSCADFLPLDDFGCGKPRKRIEIEGNEKIIPVGWGCRHHFVFVEWDLQYLIVLNKSKKIITPPECTWVIMISLN